MKKSFLMLGVAVLAAFVSCKKETPAADVLELLSTPETVITKDGTDTPLTVTFKATKAWTASVDADFATITPKSGDPADECKVKINVAANETEADRTFTVTLKSEGVTPVTVTFKQESQFHMNIDPLEFSVTTAGGDFTVNVDANVEFTVTDYSDGSFPWQHAVPANGSYKVTIDANTGYDPRTSYVKFKTSEIQVPTIDPETGEPTGEMEDLTIRVYFYQEGLAQTAWMVAIPDEMANGAKYTITNYSGELLLCGAGKVAVLDPATGAVKDYAEPGQNIEITTDDAGNFLMFAEQTVSVGGQDLKVIEIAAIKKGHKIGDDIPEGDMTELVLAIDDCWCAGVANIRARGDVFGDGVVVGMAGGYPSYGGVHYGAVWEIKGGKADWKTYGDSGMETAQPQWLAVPAVSGGDLWTSTRGAIAPLGVSAADGFLYDGYDGVYALRAYKGGNWNDVTTIGDWANGVSSIRTGKWGEKNIAAINNMAWFPYWAMPSQLILVNLDDMSVITTLNILGDAYPEDATWAEEPTTDTYFAVNGNDLEVYAVDSAQGVVCKYVLPTL